MMKREKRRAPPTARAVSVISPPTRTFKINQSINQSINQ